MRTPVIPPVMISPFTHIPYQRSLPGVLSLSPDSPENEGNESFTENEGNGALQPLFPNHEAQENEDSSGLIIPSPSAEDNFINAKYSEKKPEIKSEGILSNELFNDNFSIKNTFQAKRPRKKAECGLRKNTAVPRRGRLPTSKSDHTKDTTMFSFSSLCGGGIKGGKVRVTERRETEFTVIPEVRSPCLSDDNEHLSLSPPR